jgi:DnaJ-domain-containing protein 1
MGIFARLGDVLRSYLIDGNSGEYKNARFEEMRYNDPDLEAAFDELNEFLGVGRQGGTSRRDEQGRAGPYRDSAFAKGSAGKAGEPPPETLRPDFAELGLQLGASEEDCKQAYKKLLKIHHPDRHAGHEGNMKKATEKSARINAAYDRIQRWREGGRI